MIGVIAPWNYPFHNVYNHIVSGIFSGNAVVSKVSEYTCWSSRCDCGRGSWHAALRCAWMCQVHPVLHLVLRICTDVYFSLRYSWPFRFDESLPPLRYLNFEVGSNYRLKVGVVRCGRLNVGHLTPRQPLKNPRYGDKILRDSASAGQVNRSFFRSALG